MRALSGTLIPVILVVLTLAFISMKGFYPYGGIGHELLVQAFYVVIVLTAFLKLRLLFPLVLLYIIVHSVADGFVHGSVPVATVIQSLVQLFVATVLYAVISLKEKAYMEKNRLIDTMRQGHAHFGSVFNEDGHLVDGRFLSVNKAFADMLGLNPSLFQDLKLSTAFESFPKEWFNQFLHVMMHGDSNELSSHVEILNKHFRVSLYSPEKGQGAVLMQDITKYKRATKQIEYLNRHDTLTGFFNRGHLMEVLKAEINERNAPLGVVVFDIDNLKLLNSAFDPSAGDEAITIAADIIRDLAPEGAMLFRYGGDEFAVLLTDAEALPLQAFAREVELEFSSRAIRQVSMTLSSGVIVKNDGTNDKETIMMQAEEELYHRKAVHMNSSHIYLLKGLLELLTAKYDYEKVHSERVSRLSRELGEAMGLSDLEVQELIVVAMFHDIGKISIPDAILGKPGKLTVDEFETIKEHTTIGYKILKAADPYTRICEYVLYHHERYDGTGYPEGLKGASIPLLSRIITVVDAYEAMTSKREYSPPMSREKAIEEIRAHTGTQFDPEISEKFIAMISKRKEGNEWTS